MGLWINCPHVASNVNKTWWDCCTCLTILGHQKCSHNKDKVWLWPWWPASLWHPFRVATQWALGTANSRRSSVSPLGIEHRYKAPWWIIKLYQFHRCSWLSLLEACSARSTFKSVFFCAFSQSKTALNAGSSLWASANQLHAFALVCGLQWHVPLAPSDGHPQLWWGCELWSDALLLMLLHQGWISPCLGPVEW